MPGTLTNVTRSADVIIGLMLVLLAHGLRRRKRRAWQAVLALLVFDIVIHFLHFPRDPRPYSAVVAIVLLAVLLFLHEDFYAVGDPRTRWNALAGLRGPGRRGPGHRARLPCHGTAGRQLLVPQRLQDVVYELVGVYGPVQWASDARGDLYHLLTSALGLFTLVVTVYLFLRPAQPRARLAGGRRGHGSASCSPGRATGTRSATSRCATTRA